MLKVRLPVLGLCCVLWLCLLSTMTTTTVSATSATNVNVKFIFLYDTTLWNSKIQVYFDTNFGLQTAKRCSTKGKSFPL